MYTCSMVVGETRQVSVNELYERHAKKKAWSIRKGQQPCSGRQTLSHPKVWNPQTA